jgi:acetyl esterase/lipase
MRRSALCSAVMAGCCSRADVARRTAQRLARGAALALPLALLGCAARGPAARAGPPVVVDCASGGYLDRQFRDVAVERGIVYSRPHDAYGVHELRMDIYRPQGDGSRQRPAIVWVHGGKFKTGDRSVLSELAMQFAQRGYLSAAIDYRLLRELAPLSRGAHEVAQSDAQSAIRYLRLHAEALGLDPQRIAIAGHSAGSITAFNVVYRHEFSGDNNDNPGPPHTVSAVVGIEGYVIRPEDIEAGDPPFELLRSGIGKPQDRPLDVEPLLARARELGIRAQTHVVKGATHPNLIREPHVHELIGRVAPFLQRYFACS